MSPPDDRPALHGPGPPHSVRRCRATGSRKTTAAPRRVPRRDAAVAVRLAHQFAVARLVVGVGVADVEAATAVDDVAGDAVVLGAQHVVAGAAVHRVDTLEPDQRVVPGETVETVVTRAADQVVVVGATGQL